ncbi:MAG: hypothetical protein ACRCXZ_07030 [Patescibacteria group bacterium]
MFFKVLEYINPNEILLQSQFWTLSLLWRQYYLGSSMLILNRQCDSLAELTLLELIDMQDCFRIQEVVSKVAFGASMFNYSCLMNHGYRCNPPKPWVHWWIRPRYNTIVEFEGVEFEDEQFGSFYDREGEQNLPIKMFDDEFRQKIVLQFKKTLSNIKINEI